MLSIHKHLTLLPLSVFVLTACSTAGGTVLPKTTPPSIVDTTATSTASPSPNITATDTLSPTLSPTFTPSATVVPIVQVLVVAEFGVVREGPDEVFQQIAVVSAGMILEAVGVSTDEFWVRVKIAPNREGWLSLSAVDPGDGFWDLPRLEMPPTPTLTPTPEAQPTIIIKKSTYVQGEYAGYQLINFIPGEIVTVTITHIATGKLLNQTQKIITTNGEARGYFETGTYRGTIYETDIGIYKITASGNQGSYAEVLFELVSP